MKLTVENLGVISKAEVDLSKDLIIFTGENNTGKTYLGYVIYFLLKRLDSLLGFVGTTKSFKELIINSDPISSRIRSTLNHSIQIKKSLDELFSAKKGTFSNAKFDIEISDSLIRYAVLELGTFLIPAERQGINLFHKELSLIKNKTFDSLLQNGSRTNLLNFLQTRFNKYPLPIKDSLEFNQILDSIKKEKSEYTFLADELEKEFLQGNVQIDNEGDIAFKPANSKKSIEFHLTSSTVKSLSSLSIYLRHVAEKGDFIIIDEPELNLHPDNQRKIARFISRLIHEGFKVMISTHSDYIIRELNNLIMLGSSMKSNPEKTKELQKRYKYKNEELLSKEKVGVYLFKQNKPVKKVRVTKTGFDISTIDKEVEKLNQSSQDIYFTLFD